MQNHVLIYFEQYKQLRSNYLKGIKVIFKAIAICFFGLIVLFLAFQSTFLQKQTVLSISKWINKHTNYQIHVDGINFNIFNSLYIDNLTIHDKDSLPLLTAETVYLDFSWLNFVSPGALIINTFDLENAHFYLTYSDSNSNVNEFSRQFGSLIQKVNSREIQTLTLTDKKLSKSKPKNILIKDISINNGFFHYCNNSEIKSDSLFSFNNLNIWIKKSKLKNLKVKNGKIDFELLSLEGQELFKKFGIKNFSSKFSYSDSAMTFSKVKIKAINHYLRADYINFSYKNPIQLAYVDSFDLEINIQESYLSLAHLDWIYTPLKNFEDTIVLKGNLSKKQKAIALKNIDLLFGQDSKAHITEFTSDDYRFWTVADYKASELDLKTNKTDIEIYLPKDYLHPELTHFDLQTDFDKNAETLILKGKLNTNLAKLGFQGQMLHNHYNLDIETEHVYVSSILKLKNFPFTLQSSKINLKGRDLNYSLSVDSVKIQADSLTLMARAFKNINIALAYDQKIIYTDYTIHDSKVHLKGRSIIDLNHEHSSHNIQLQHFNWQRLGLLKTPLITKASLIDIETNYFNLKDLYGQITLNNIELFKAETQETIEHLYIDIESDTTLGNKQMYLSSEVLDASIHFDIPSMKHFSYLNQVFENIQNNLLLNPSLKPYKTYSTSPYDMDLVVKLHDINSLINFFTLPIRISKESKFELDMTLGDLSHFYFNLKTDSLSYENFTACGLDIKANLAQKYNGQFNTFLTLKSQKQIYKNFINDKMDINLHNRLDKHIFTLSTKNTLTNTVLNLSGQINLLDSNTSHIHFQDDSYFYFLDTTWTINKNNRIVLTQDSLSIEDLDLTLDKQAISLSANLSHKLTDYLRLTANKLDCGVIGEYMNKDFTGLLNFDFLLYTPYENPSFSIKTLISEPTFQGIIFDTLLIESKRLKNKTFDLFGYLAKDQNNIVDVRGKYTFDQALPFLDLDMIFRHLPVHVMEPFVNKYVSELGGEIIGEVRLKGAINDLFIEGEAHVLDAQLKLNELNTIYTLSDKISFKDNGVYFDNIIIEDENKKEALLNGSIKHNNFKELTYNLSVDLREFIVMNISENPDALYYGLATMTGFLNIQTNQNQIIEIDLMGYTDKGTHIFFPFNNSSLSQANALEQTYITFLKNPNDFETTKKIQDSLDVIEQSQFFTLNMDIEVTPYANVQMIFDQKQGDIIRGRGRGNLNINYDSKKKMTMFGEVSIVEGDYHFTLLNIVDKKFIIEPESTISWSGNPYDAKLNIKASYNQRASLLPILDNTNLGDLAEFPEAKIQYPIKVLLLLDGYVRKPNIHFGIDFENYPLIFEDVIESFKHQVAVNPQERNKQVFSLIALKRFAELNKFSITQSAAKLVTELFSNQFSYWASQVDPNLEININIENDEQDALDNLQLSISYSFFNGRVRVSHDNIQNFEENREDNSNNNIIGDWMVEYSFLQKGNLKLKMYHQQSNKSSANFTIQNGSKTGFSILYTEKASSFKDLFKKK